MSGFSPIPFDATTSGMCQIPLDTTSVSVAGQELVNSTPAFYSQELEERRWSLILGEFSSTEIVKQLEEPAQEDFWTSTWNGFKNVASAINKAVSFPGAQAAPTAKAQEEDDEGYVCDFEGATLVTTKILPDGSVKKIDIRDLYPECRIIMNLEKSAFDFSVGKRHKPLNPKKTKIERPATEESHPTPDQLKADLFNAVKNGELSRTRKLLATVDANSVDEEGMTPLHWAAKNGELSITEEILKHNPNTNVLDNAGGAPLHWAILNSELSITKALLRGGANPNLPTGTGKSPLKLAITNDELSITEAVLDAGADVNAIDQEGNTPLHLAVSKGALTIAEKILEHKPNMNVLDAAGGSPLHRAILGGELSITKAMLQAVADPNLLTRGGSSPLNLAIEQGEYSIAKELLNAEADPDLVDNKGRRPLHFAIQKREYSIVEALLQKKADSTKVDGAGKTVKDRALETGDCELMDLLEQYGIDVPHKKEPSVTWKGAKPGSRLKLGDTSGVRGLKITYMDVDTRIFLDSNSQIDEKVQKLADSFAKDLWIDHKPALIWSVENGKIETMKALIQGGVDVNGVDDQGQTALHKAVEAKSIFKASLLLKYGANPMAKDDAGNTPLSLAGNDKKMIDLLSLYLKFQPSDE